jgi:hypothetical protein
MPEYPTADQTRDEYVAAMGKELGALFYALRIELCWTHARWHQHRILFGTKPDRVTLLNRAAPGFFNIVQDLTFDDTVLSIARLVSSSTSAGRRQLTVRALPPLLTEPLRTEVSDLVAAAVKAASFAKDRRNRRIAHRDLELLLNPSAQPLEAASRRAVEEALAALRAVLDRVNAVTRQTTTSYELHLPGDAEGLLYVLREGLSARAQRRDRRRRGELRPEDLGPPPPI